PSSAPDCTDSIRDSSIDIETPPRRSAKSSAKSPPEASARARTRSATPVSNSSGAPLNGFPPAGHLDQPSRRDEQLGRGVGVFGMVDGAAAAEVEAGERPPRGAATAHVGGGLVGVARDAVEEDPVWLRRGQISSPAASSRSSARMSKSSSEARANRSVTAT